MMLNVSSISPMSIDNEVIFHCITDNALQDIKHQITRPLFHSGFDIRHTQADRGKPSRSNNIKASTLKAFDSFLEC